MPDIMYGCFYKKASNDSYEKLLYDENVYLAEDRTLCMGIHQNKFKLTFLPDAHAWVDPIKTLYGLLGQRKRWINGSFFAFDKVK
jgi:chitin synthase